MSLHPTKTRLALLRAIDDGAVHEQYPIPPKPPYAEWDNGPGWWPRRLRRLRVTARVRELYNAGWVRLGDREYSHYRSPRRFEITDAGREVLRGAS